MQNWSVALEETHCLQQEKKCHHGTVCAAAITTPPFAASKAPPTAKAQIEVPSLVIKYFLRAATFQNFYRETTNPPLHTAKDEETAASKAEGSLQLDRSSKMNAISMKLYERLALMYSLTCTPTCSFILYLIKLVTALFHRSQTISFSWGNHFLCQMNYQKNWKKNVTRHTQITPWIPPLRKKGQRVPANSSWKPAATRCFLASATWKFGIAVWSTGIWGMWDMFGGKNTSRIAKQVFTTSSGRLPVQWTGRYQ